MDLMHDGGVVGGHLTKERWVEVCSAAPARMFGLAGVKGVVAPGADADLVVYDPARKHKISASTHHMNVDYSIYEGREVTGGSRRGAVARPGDRRERRVEGRKGLGQVPAPQDGARVSDVGGLTRDLRVIGAGLPRTGTRSLKEALEQLLAGALLPHARGR